MKTTKDDFEYFKRKCDLWIEVFGLMSWNITYKHERLQSEWLASCNANYSGRNATLALSTHWKYIKTSEKELNKSAFHEVMELLLSPLYGQARSRVWDEEEFERAIHEIIRTFENVMLKKEEI